MAICVQITEFMRFTSMVNWQHFYSAFLVLLTHSHTQTRAALLRQFSRRIFQPMRLMWGFSVYPNDTLKCGLEKPEMEPPTFWLAVTPHSTRKPAVFVCTKQYGFHAPVFSQPVVWEFQSDVDRQSKFKCSRGDNTTASFKCSYNDETGKMKTQRRVLVCRW